MATIVVRVDIANAHASERLALARTVRQARVFCAGRGVTPEWIHAHRHLTDGVVVEVSARSDAARAACLSKAARACGAEVHVETMVPPRADHVGDIVASLDAKAWLIAADGGADVNDFLALNAGALESFGENATVTLRASRRVRSRSCFLD